MLIRTDDVIEGGDTRFDAVAKRIEARFEFGKIVDLMNVKNGSLVGGRRVQQHADFGFTTHMNDYADTLQPVTLKRNLKDKDGSRRRC